MPRCGTIFDIMDDEDDFRISVVDVYDIAADIGKEFEKIIDQFGPDALTSLMPRVITALEQLERVAEKQETSGSLIEELRSAISVLEHQKLGQAENRQRYTRDLEDIERDMREEKQELSAKVTQLLDENRKLSTCLARSADNTPSLTDDESSLEPEVTRSIVGRLQDALEGQRDQLHTLQQQLQHKLAENDQLSTQIERLTQGNKDLRRRSRQSTQQIRQLVEERAELHVSLQEHQRSLDQLNQRLGLAAKENYDLATATTSEPDDLSSKVVYDRNDPNRPRFTLVELKDILYQRNELKARLSDLEDELSVYRPAKQQRSHIICPPEEANSPPLVNLDRLLLDEGSATPAPDPTRASDHQLQDDAASSPSPDPYEDDPPVQGPMPNEPFDAPWRRGPRESGIRKFFQKMKKLSGVMLSSGDAVLGTPTVTTTNLNHRPYRRPLPPHHHLYHSTPTTAYCTPCPSLNVSSPPSLRSLPSKLNNTRLTIEDSTYNSSSSIGRDSTTGKFGDAGSNSGDAGGPRNTGQSTSDVSMTSLQTPKTNSSDGSSRKNGTGSGNFSLERFRTRFSITSGSSGSSANLKTTDRPSNLNVSSADSSSSVGQSNSSGSSGGDNQNPNVRSDVIQVPPLLL